MAHDQILGAREMHAVRTLDTEPSHRGRILLVNVLGIPKDTAPSYRAAHAEEIAVKQSAGLRVKVHDSPRPVIAYINYGYWVVNCECGAGNATDPEWGVALCFACGATHWNVVFPDDREEVEAALLARPLSKNRNWKPGETIIDLLAENAAHNTEGTQQ